MIATATGYVILCLAALAVQIGFALFYWTLALVTFALLGVLLFVQWATRRHPT